MSWIAQHFVNPSFVLPGAALIAAPIILHLINRLRYRRVRFAAMEFLLQSDKRNRRRIMLEQLLLLLLRILLVLAAVALVARLILDPTQLALFRGAKSHHVILLDDSGSMQDRLHESTAFEQAIAVVNRLLDEGASQPNTQRLTLLRMSAPDQPLFTERDVNEIFLDDARSKLDNMRCTHQSLDMAYAVDVAGKHLEGQRAGGRYVHVITDFRAQDWTGSSGLATALERLDEEEIAVSIVRTVTRTNENRAITRLAADGHSPATGVPIRLEVGVVNHAGRVERDVGIAIFVDGERLPATVTLESIEPGSEVTTQVDVTINEPGLHTLEAQLESDALTIDNRRYMTLDVAPTNPVLLIDGSPGQIESELVATALAADSSITGIDPAIERVDYLRTHSLDHFACVYMLNVPEIPADAVDALNRYVAGGGGLVWFAGDLVQPVFYNRILFVGGRDGLFPVPLAAARGQLTRERSVSDPDLALTDHPVFRIFTGQNNPFIDSVRIESYWPTARSFTDAEGAEHEWTVDDNLRRDGVRAIARLRNRDPLVFEHTFGAGRVVTFLTTAGPGWNNWSRNPSFVVGLLELQKHVARGTRTGQEWIVGEPIRLSLSPNEFLGTVEVIPANSDDVNRVAATAAGDTAGSNSRELTVKFPRTDTPGVYRVRMFDHHQVPSEEWYAYNAPVAESNLATAAVQEFQARLTSGSGIVVQDAERLTRVGGQDAGRELRHALLFLIALVLILEQVLAVRLSYHAPVAGSAA